MLSDHGLAALRKAATLAHAVPSVRLRIRDGDRVILAVQTPPLPVQTGGRTLPPCAFRAAVARAHELRSTGQRVAFCGLPEDHDPAIDVGLREGDVAHPGGIYRVAMADQWLLLFATTLGLESCKDAACGDGLATDTDDPGDRFAVRVGFHNDIATGVTLVHTATPIGDRTEAARHLDLLEALLARFGADELVAALSFSTP